MFNSYLKFISLKHLSIFFYLVVHEMISMLLLIYFHNQNWANNAI